jgi:hypothetical protein
MMKKFDDEANGLNERAVDHEDSEFDQALKNFKSSVHAWSDAVYSRPRAFTKPAYMKEVRLRSWRLALGWALGCVVVAGSVSGGLLERHHRLEVARVAAGQRAAEQQKRLREQPAGAQVSDEALLAEVDSDVARQVPSALEPLGQMMADDETK